MHPYILLAVFLVVGAVAVMAIHFRFAYLERTIDKAHSRIDEVMKILQSLNRP